MAKSSKAYGSEGGFNAPTEVVGDYTMLDGDVISVTGPADITLPNAYTAEVGVIVHCKSDILTILTQGSDSIFPPENNVIYKDEANRYSPSSVGWVVV